MIQLGFVIGLAVQMMSPWQPFQAQFVGTALGRPVTVCIDNDKVETTFAGKMCFRDEKGTWYSVCADVRSPIAQGQTMTVRPASSTRMNANVVAAGTIVAKYFRQAQTADQCAGLQLAVWKTLEDGPNFPNFEAGALQARASSSVMAYALQYYQAGAEAPQASIALQSVGGGQSQLSPPVI